MITTKAKDTRYLPLVEMASAYFLGGTGTIIRSSNIAALVRTGPGVYNLTFVTPMKTANYLFAVTSQQTQFAYNIGAEVTGKTVNGCTLTISNNASAADLQANAVALYE
jgi:hypothetical protein